MNGDPTVEWTGRQLGGRYTLRRLIGTGGMGAVYEATQDDLGRQVAVKMLYPHLALSDTALARFRREALGSAALGHPNIVQVNDFGDRPGEPPFIVMEYLHGQTLANAMAAGPLPAARVASVASQVLGALEAAHRAGIVHRDIKPANLFLTPLPGVGDMVKVLDFGVAKHADADVPKLTESGALVGTLAYMAPEQVRGEAVGPTTDIYALGATLYHALAGRPAFVGDTQWSLMLQISDGTPPPLASVRPELDPRWSAMLERAMARDPASRFQTAAEMLQAVAAISGAQAWPSSGPSAVFSGAPAAVLAATGSGSMAYGPTIESGASHPAVAPTIPGEAPGPTFAATHPAVAMPSPDDEESSSTAVAMAIVVGLVVLALLGGGLVLLSAGGDVEEVAAVRPTPAPGATQPVDPVAAEKDQAQRPSPITPAPGGSPAASSPTASPPDKQDTPGPGATEPSPGDAPTIWDRFDPKEAPQPPPAAEPVTDRPRKRPKRPKPDPKPKQRFSGTKASVAFIHAHSLYTGDHSRKVFSKPLARYSACFAKFQFEPPKHPVPGYHVTVDARGNVTRVAPRGSGPRHKGLDACMTKAFKTLRFGPPNGSKGGVMDVDLRARIPG